MASLDGLRAYKWLISSSDPRLDAPDDQILELPPLAILKGLDRLAKISIGVHRFYDEADRPNLEDLQLASYAPLGACHRVEELTNTSICPSPWHAALLLSSMAQMMQSKGAVLLFRGQADHRWLLKPSMSRLGQDALPKAESRLSEFIAEFRSRPLPRGLSVDRSIGEAAAQHFGVMTNLLDWTFDPLVAVWFAMSREHVGEESKENGLPIVWMLPVNHFVKNGLRIALPDPSVRRIYDQRGVLLDMTFSQEAWEPHAYKVIFDNKDKNRPGFSPFWHGKGRRMYSPTDWVAGIASRQAGTETPVPRFPRVNLGRWAGLVYETIYSMCVTCNALGEDVTVNTDVLGLIVEQNLAIVGLLAESIEAENVDVEASPDKELANLLRSMLGEIGSE